MSIQWAFVVFKLLAGTGAALLGFVGLAELLNKRSKASRTAIVTALVILVIAGCAALFQVGKPERIMSVVRNLSLTSPISWELLSYGMAVAVGIVYLLFARSKGTLIKVLAIIAVIVAVAVGITTGYSHISMIGMPSWRSPAIPAGFLMSALLLGGLVYLAIACRNEDNMVGRDFIDVVIVLAVLATISYVALGLTTELKDYAFIYWMIAPVLGGAVSVASTVYLRMTQSMLWLIVSITSALIGAVAIRAIIWPIVETGLRTGDSIVHI